MGSRCQTVPVCSVRCDMVTWHTDTTTTNTAMVSRRKILSQSRDELSYVQEEEEDVWYTKDKLYKDHIQEVRDKWESIDDEIWAKIVVLERNRRVAKAYARAPVVTVNGTDEGFDGFRIGVSGFDNPMRDIGTEETIRQINQGFKLKMDDMGNILIKRLSKSPVYAKNTSEENALSNEIIKLQNGLLDYEKPFKLFDMKKFQQNVNREIKRQYPDRRKLESQCISLVSFGTSSSDILDCPIWILIINVVAMEMLRTKIPPRDNGIYGAIWSNSSSQGQDKKEKKKQPGDDPYYFGLSARIPNFVKSRKKKQKERSRMMAGHGQNAADMSNVAPNSLPSHPFWWHTRIYPDNMGCRGEPRPAGPTSMMPYVTDSSDSDYSHIYGRLPIPTRGLRKFPTKPLFLSQWE